MEPTALTADAAGNFYVAGWNAYGGFPSTVPTVSRPGAQQGMPVFVQAIAADGSRFIYALTINPGGDASFRPEGIAADPTGAAYLTGKSGQQFPITDGAYQTTTNGSVGAAVVMKLTPAGALGYSTYLGTALVTPTAIAVDGGGNAYAAGHASSGLPTLNPIQSAPAGGDDAFLTKLNAAGSALVFSTYLGGSLDDAATAVGLDAVGNVYLAGGTDSTDFPQRNALPPAFGTAASNFVTMLTPAGNGFVYSTYFADAQTFVGAMAVTAGGSVYLTGNTGSTSYPTVRPYQPTLVGSSDGFIARIDPGSSALCPSGQFFAEYFSNISLRAPATRTACETTISNDYGAGGPTGLPSPCAGPAASSSAAAA